MLNFIFKLEAQALASVNLAALSSLNLYNNDIRNEVQKTLKAWAEKKFLKIDI